MRRIISRALSAALALMLVASCGLAVSAADHPSETDTATATVYGVESGKEVTAYQIVYATYAATGEGLTGYELADGCTIADIEDPTSEEIVAIADAINNRTLTTLTSVTMEEQSDGTYTADLTAGMWLVLVRVSGTDSLVVYNPMIVSINYTDANEASSITVGYVDSEGNFVSSEEGAVYAKQSTTTLEKTVSDTGENGTYGKVVDGNIGDIKYFRIETDIPDYSAEYIYASFILTDTLSEGLVFQDDIIVYVGGTAYEASDDTYTFTYSELTNVFEISFVTDFILEHAGQTVTVFYTAEIDDDAVMAADSNPNDVTLHYSNNPAEKNEYAELTDRVYVYTFELTVEAIKVAEDGSVSVEDDLMVVVDPLEGAEFTFYLDEELTEVYTNDVFEGTATSDEDGAIKVQGLDAGTYYMTETNAPSGYAVNDTVYVIEISAEYDAEGRITEYSISITDSTEQTTKITTRTVDYVADEESGEVSAEVISVTLAPTAIEDCHLAKLPSTGTTAAIILMIVGIAGIAVIALTSKPRITD